MKKDMTYEKAGMIRVDLSIVGPDKGEYFVEVTGTFEGGSRGYFCGAPEDCYDTEYPSFEIDKIKVLEVGPGGYDVFEGKFVKWDLSSYMNKLIQKAEREANSL